MQLGSVVSFISCILPTVMGRRSILVSAHRYSSLRKRSCCSHCMFMHEQDFCTALLDVGSGDAESRALFICNCFFRDQRTESGMSVLFIEKLILTYYSSRAVRIEADLRIRIAAWSGICTLFESGLLWYSFRRAKGVETNPDQNFICPAFDSLFV